jgi:hypothetical protein
MIPLPLTCALLLHTQNNLQNTPPPPKTVEAAAYKTGTIRIFWEEVPQALTYRIYRNGTQIARTTGDTLTPQQRVYSDNTVQPNTNYTYTVASENSHGTSEPSTPYLERSFPQTPKHIQCRLLVVGANAAGVSAAVTAARYGVNTVLLEETRRLGGMAVNGLGASDIRKHAHASGFFLEFVQQVQKLYNHKQDGFHYEPRIAQQAIKQLIWTTPSLTVYRNVRPINVKSQNGTITQITAQDTQTGNKITITPQLIVDATECGDIAAAANAKHTIGREPRTPREPHAGVIYYDRAADTLLPGSTGQGDHRLQAYSYLMVVKDFGKNADKTIPKPKNYDPTKYDDAPKWHNSWATSSGILPNNKYEINQHPEGGDLQGTNYRYPQSTYQQRRTLEQQFKEHALGYLYYIQTENGMKNIGLSEDDYRDSDGWPTLLYIREARRFHAAAQMDETDILNARKIIRPNSIGIGDYAMDSHAVRPKTDPKATHMGEGEFYLPQYTPWHQIPYNIMIPADLNNLFAPTAVSATHVAYGTYRMEPVRMHFGAAAGVAAHLALKYNLTPATVPIKQIQLELLKTRPNNNVTATDGWAGYGPTTAPVHLYNLTDTDGHPKYRAIQWLAARGFWPQPPPEKRTPTSGIQGMPFKPDEPLTENEMFRTLKILLARTQTTKTTKIPNGKPETVTRGYAARIYTWALNYTQTTQTSPYADLPEGHLAKKAAEILWAHHIDTRLWDPFDTDTHGKPYFRPDKPITNAQWAELLFLASIHIDPIFADHPHDTQPHSPPTP